MTRRNDRCPCNSGRKYKDCCQHKSRVISLTANRYERAYWSLLQALQDYCFYMHENETRLARLQFFGVEEPNEEDFERMFPFFLDWLTFGCRTGTKGETTILHFAKQRQSDELEAGLLSAWSQTHPSFYEVMALNGTEATLRDCLTQQMLTAYLAEGQSLSVDLVVAGRFLPVGDTYRPGYNLLECPRGLIEQMRPVLTQELERMRRAVPHADWYDLFRERWPLICDLLSLPYLSTDEEPLVRPVPLQSERSKGLTDPPAEASAGWRIVAGVIEQFVDEARLSYADLSSLLRLWWDVALALQPRISHPQVWAASILYAWYHRVMSARVSKESIATLIGVSAASMVMRSNQIIRTLKIEWHDDRYIDPLDPAVRVAHMMGMLRAEITAAIVDPVTEFASAHPQKMRRIQRLDHRARRLLAEGQWRAVRQICTDILGINPDFPPARNNMAVAHMMEGNYTAAIAVATPVLQTHPEHLFTLAILARAYHQTGRARIARKLLHTAVTVYRGWQQEEESHFPIHDRSGDRQQLWETLVTMQQDRILYDLSCNENMGRRTARALKQSAAAAERCGDLARATEWLRVAELADRQESIRDDLQ